MSRLAALTILPVITSSSPGAAGALNFTVNLGADRWLAEMGCKLDHGFVHKRGDDAAMNDAFPSFVFPTGSEPSRDCPGSVINGELDMKPGGIVLAANIAALVVLKFLHSMVERLSLVYPIACQYNIKCEQ